MLDTVRSAVRRLLNVSDCAFQYDDDDDYYCYYVRIHTHTHSFSPLLMYGLEIYLMADLD